MAQGTFDTVRAAKRDRYPESETDTRRVRVTDPDGWNREVLAEMADDLVWSRYADRVGRVR